MGESQNWTLAMKYRSHRSAFSAAMVWAKTVSYVKILFLVWRMIFGDVRVREGANFSTLFRDLTDDTPPWLPLLYHYGNELGTVVPFRLIYNTVMFVAALSDIFRERWGAKKGGLYLSQ